MYYLTRLLFRALAGKPVAQVVVGIILIPVGGLISYAALTGEYIFFYWTIAGIVFAIGGIILVIRGATTLLKPKPSVQQAMLQQMPYTGPGQYAQPYSQPQYPQQVSYGQSQQDYERIHYPEQ